MGGSAGHMRHPHDLDSVNSGNDLIKLFEDIRLKIENLETTPNVKIDGINVSFKYANGEFAVDRGSLQEIDTSGVTMSRIGERFPPGHGMVKAITTLLTILNEAEPIIRPEIKRLGLIDNPFYFLNTEYVEGTTNSIGYQEDFIAIHGVNAFYEKSFRGNTRIGLPRPIDPVTSKPEKDPSVEIPYDKNAMMSLIQKLNPIAKKYNYKVYGPIPTSSKQTNIDFEKSLSTPISINISPDVLLSHPELSKYLNKNLGQLLNSIQQKPGRYPNYPLYLMNDGKKRNPYHKETYLQIIEEGIPVDQLCPPENIEPFVKGAILMHADRLLGNDILSGLTSEIGDMVGDDGGHEGVVIRDDSFGPYPFKLTGEFIKTGMFGVISQKMADQKTTVTESYLRRLIRESIRRIII